MNTYIILLNYTDQGIRTASESPERFARSQQEARSFGCEVKAFYATLGAYDFVEVIEAPDDASIAKLVLSVGAAGNVRTTTIKAFTESEFKKIAQGIK
jgi:uncharacterized protein with GYD domain